MTVFLMLNQPVTHDIVFTVFYANTKHAQEVSKSILGISNYKIKF